jgi:hypothetical protein
MRIKVTSLAILYQKRGMGYRKKRERMKEQKALVFKKRRRERK